MSIQVERWPAAGSKVLVLACLLLLAGFLRYDVVWGQKAGSTGEPAATVHITVFTSAECAECNHVKDIIIPELKERHGDSLVIRYVDADDGDNYDLLSALERRAGDTDNELPVIFCGDKILGGRPEVEVGLAKTIEQYLQTGGANAIDLTVEQEVRGETGAPIHVAYFNRSGCRKCGRVERTLAALERRYPHVTVRWFDLAEPENKLLAEAMGQRYGVPEERRLVAPTVFVGHDALVEDQIREESLRVLMEKYQAAGAEPLWEQAAADTSRAARGIIQRFQGLGILTVMLAGLIDGINPCAFTTIVFLISYLAFVGRTRREVLLAGAAFTVAVFLTYFGVGLGFFQFLQRLTFLNTLSQIIYALAAALVFILAALSFYDYTLIRRGRRSSEMILQLPQFLKRRIHQAIRKQSRSGRLALGAFLTGAVVSLLELACTGQVYLPTIVFVTGVEGLKTHAFLYLFLYNLLFVLPLAAVFLISYMGVTSQQIGAVMEAHLDRVKLALGSFFLLLGVLLVIILLN